VVASTSTRTIAKNRMLTGISQGWILTRRVSEGPTRKDLDSVADPSLAGALGASKSGPFRVYFPAGDPRYAVRFFRALVFL
jgi:hypothetical protein